MKEVFTEIGIGHGSPVSTEIEEGGKEYRVPKLILPLKITEFYLRVWLGRTVFTVSIPKGIRVKKKSKRSFKLLLGIGGIGSH